MYLPLQEKISEQFYTWESRGRGWLTWDYPVVLEPPFTKFQTYTPSFKIPIKESGFFKSLLSSGDKSGTHIPEQIGESPRPPVQQEGAVSYSELQIQFPKGEKYVNAELDSFLLMVGFTEYPICFEIIGLHDAIFFQFVCREIDSGQLKNQLRTHFPKIKITERSGFLKSNIIPASKTQLLSFGLSEEFMRPIKTIGSFGLDPLIGFLSVADNLERDEIAVLQIQFHGVSKPWSESIVKSVMTSSGDSNFTDAPDMVRLAKQKVSKPLFSVVINSMVQSNYRVRELAKSVSIGIKQFTNHESNELIEVTGLSNKTLYRDICFRESHRSGMILNSDELAGFVHFPFSSHSPKIYPQSNRRTKSAPDIASGHSYTLGVNIHEGNEKEVSLSVSQRLKHIHVIGATGSGKSTLIENLIIQDIINGNGVAVLDPHGDLIENIVGHISPRRFSDVVFVNPEDSDWPFGLNIIQAHSEIEKDVLSSDLVDIFERFSSNWGVQMSSIFSNAILAFVESKQGGSLLDLKRFLVDKAFRNEFLKTVEDSSIKYYWLKEYPLMRSGSIGPIITRIDTFLRPKIIRNMVVQREGVRFDHLIDSGKIVLVKLSQGLIGKENSYILGSMIMAKIHQAAIARQSKEIKDRKPFFLYVDEANNFLNPSMSSILSGARKYGLGLVLAHQDLSQLTKQDAEISNSIITNAGTRICFRVGEVDAKRLADGFSSFESKDLQNLSVGEAIVRVEGPDFDFNIDTYERVEISKEQYTNRRNEILNISRDRYCVSKKSVEALIAQFYETPDIPEEAKVKSVEVVVNKEVRESKKKDVDEIKTKAATPDLVEAIKGPRKEKIVSKEETVHRYLQNFIKKTAESFGFKAVLEETVPGGKVDVGLTRGSYRVAVEISHTNTNDYELKNIRKCLSAGFSTVILCPTEQKDFEKLKKFVFGKLTKPELDKVFVFQPGDVHQFLCDVVIREGPTENTVKGYRVKVKFHDESSEKEKNIKKDDISKIVYESIRKLKK